MDDIDRLADWAVPLLAALQPQQRRQLARQIARELRTDNTKHMRAQVAPDGSPWTARKTQPAREQRGKLRAGAMFTKMRLARHFKIRATDGEAAAFFKGMVERIARVHHYGLRDRVKPGGPMHEYAQRQLLGITPEFEQRVQDMIIDHLAASKM